MNRRNFIGSVLAAPAIVHSDIIMPVRRIWTPGRPGFEPRNGWRHVEFDLWLDREVRVELDGTVYHVYRAEFPRVA